MNFFLNISQFQFHALFIDLLSRYIRIMFSVTKNCHIIFLQNLKERFEYKIVSLNFFCQI